MSTLKTCLKNCSNSYWLLLKLIVEYNDENIVHENEDLLGGLKHLSELYDTGGHQSLLNYYKKCFDKYKNHEYFQSFSPLDWLVCHCGMVDEVFTTPRYINLHKITKHIDYFTKAIYFFNKLLDKIPPAISIYLVQLSTLVKFIYFHPKISENVFLKIFFFSRNITIFVMDHVIMQQLVINFICSKNIIFQPC